MIFSLGGIFIKGIIKENVILIYYYNWDFLYFCGRGI